jgi:hypothetical protein
MDSFEKGMDAVRAAHKWRSHKKNEPKLVSQIPQKDLKTLSKKEINPPYNYPNLGMNTSSSYPQTHHQSD